MPENPVSFVLFKDDFKQKYVKSQRDRGSDEPVHA